MKEDDAMDKPIPPPASHGAPPVPGGANAPDSPQQALLREFDHDARSPLSALAAATELLGATDDPALQEEARGVIGRQVRKLNELFAAFRARLALLAHGRSDPPG
jgi:hypothetical protein